MGLSKSFLKFIAYEHKEKLFTGPVLTLGRQSVQATLGETRRLLLSAGITPANLSTDKDVRINMPSWFNAAYENPISDVAFFNLLGITEIMALDYSDYEGAEIQHDLNYVIPNELQNRFSLIIDGGTLEHLFDIKQSLINIATMLKTGGRIIHFSPASNFVNHGFYQFSPTLFFDYYGANGFGNLKGFLVEHNLSNSYPHPVEWFNVGVEGRFATNRALEVVFIAEKLATSTVDVVPMQASYCQKDWIRDEPRDDGRSISDQSDSYSAKAMIKRILPESVKVYLRRYVPGIDPRRKPWGLKRWDKL